jgi:cytochrome c
MFMRNSFYAVIIAFEIATTASAGNRDTDIGTPASAEELAKFFAILPDGTGLPPGGGTAATGAKIYAKKCAHCHGQDLKGLPDLGGPALIGGRGSLATTKPLKTVESYWPYASTLYDYIWRSMPFDQPGSLTADEVYSLSAYILAEGKIINADQQLDAATLPKTVMPNSDGFYDGSGPDVELYRAAPVPSTAK